MSLSVFLKEFKESADPGFVTEAVPELLCDNRFEEIFSPPDIINPLSVSVQASSKKRLILDLRYINVHIFNYNKVRI